MTIAFYTRPMSQAEQTMHGDGLLGTGSDLGRGAALGTQMEKVTEKADNGKSYSVLSRVKRLGYLNIGWE